LQNAAVLHLPVESGMENNNFAPFYDDLKKELS
jgi:hypothetical protein